jgi:deazaflavin-dependent oxidoreductase (nitroreductase family)
MDWEGNVIINLQKSQPYPGRGATIKGESMTTEEPILDSPSGWVREHIREYVESDGQKGHLWRGIPTLLVTTRGRKSGLLRRTALIYGQSGPDYLIVASNGGSKDHPLWYLNLSQNPQVEIQVEALKFTAQARTATPEEKQRLWPIMAKIFPTYDRYLVTAAQAGRDIPLVILSPL